LGRGATRYVQDNTPRFKERVEQLQIVLRHLLPVATDVSLQTFSTKILDLAGTLKAGMMEEQALYQVFWVGCREAYQENRINVVDDNPSGPVLFCTFPGLERVDQDRDVTVVKASGLLRHAFKTN